MDLNNIPIIGAQKETRLIVTLIEKPNKDSLITMDFDPPFDGEPKTAAQKAAVAMATTLVNVYGLNKQSDEVAQPEENKDE